MKVNNKNSVNAERINQQKMHIFLYCLFFFMFFVWFVIRAGRVGSPLLGSDEYAFLTIGKFLDSPSIFTLDSNLQQVSNRLYFYLLSFFDFKPGVIFQVRVVQIVEWFAAVVILFAAFRNFIGVNYRLIAAAFTLILPSSFYVLTVIPETSLVLLSSALGLVICRTLPKYAISAISLSGLICGVGILIKPHAIAWIPAVVVVIIFNQLIESRKQHWAVSSFGLILVFFFFWYAGAVLAWRLTSSGWIFNPAEMLGLKFYGSSLRTSETSNFFTTAREVIKYFLQHLIVLSLIFCTSLIGIFVIFKDALQRKGQAQNHELIPAIFVVAMLFGSLVMTSYFTASVGLQQEHESNRLHGRYIAHILVFLPFFHFYYVSKATASNYRGYAYVSLLTVLVALFYVFPSVKIFPWDYPELFALYEKENWYKWVGISKSSYGNLVLPLIACVSALQLLRLKYKAHLITLQLLAILICANLQLDDWASTHVANNQKSVQTGGKLSALIGANLPGEGLVVGPDRYGKLSYFLFGFNGAPRVLIKGRGEIITQDEIASSKWVILTDQYEKQFQFQSVIGIEGVQFFPLNLPQVVVSIPPAVIWRGEPLTVSFSSESKRTGMLDGFNAPEPWGAWTAIKTAHVYLPVSIHGAIRLKFFGWVDGENKDKVVTLRVGTESKNITLTKQGLDYEVDFYVAEPSSVIQVTIPTTRPLGSDRHFGVALRGVEISRSQK